MLAFTKNICVYSPRQLLKTKRYFSVERTCKEIRIPGPFGDLAGKWWGPRDKRPILGLHGWQDNSGTFDTLAPLLPPHIGFLAIDFPGHGLSPQLPPGSFYHGIDLAVMIRRVVEHFGWPKVSILAHSLGAMQSFAYSILFPDSVDFLIFLDGLFPRQALKNGQPEGMAKTIDDFLKYDAHASSGREPPSYTFAELEQLLFKGARGSLDEDKCKYILRRNIAQSKNDPDRFYFTRDPRLKVPNLLHWPVEGIIASCKRVTCPLFLSLGKDSLFLSTEPIILKIFEAMKSSNKNIVYHKVEGTHHLHLNTPENVSGLINDFIAKYDVGDRSVFDSIENKLRVVASL